MRSEQEIALQLTLKAIDRMATHFSNNSAKEDNQDFSKQIVDFYNNIYKNLDRNIYT